MSVTTLSFITGLDIPLSSSLAVDNLRSYFPTAARQHGTRPTLKGRKHCMPHIAPQHDVLFSRGGVPNFNGLYALQLTLIGQKYERTVDA